jgi:repressor LexA
MTFVTRRQKQIFDFLVHYLRRKGYAPTIEETADHFGLKSLATVHKHFSNLESKGLIRRSWNRSRALEILPDESPDGGVPIPLLGYVAAGSPIEAIETRETLTVPPDLAGAKGTYALRVRGESMIDEQIRDGDYVVVENRQSARDGEMVIALVGNEGVTLKKLFREREGRVRLQPANPSLQPIFVDEADLRIQGVVIGLLRKY